MWWTRRRFFAGVAACALVSVLLRLRFVFTPLTVDEGGFVAIARAWSHGKILYTDVWVDRPQGLLALFRLWNFIAFDNAQSVRVLAILFGILAVFGSAIIARSISTRRAGVLAALFVAVMSAAPRLEGFIANGELLSGALSVLGLALGCVVLFGGWRRRWMFGAGVLAGVATSIKQSGYDGLLTLCVFLVLAAIFKWRGRRNVAIEFGLLLGGFAVVWLLLAVHGAFIGWDNWVYAIAGYRLEGRSALSGADWPRFRLTARIAAPIMVPALLAAAACSVAGLASRGRRPFEPRWIVPPLWLLIGALAFATGGQFHHHYWITLTFPVGVTSAVAIASVSRRLVGDAISVLVL